MKFRYLISVVVFYVLAALGFAQSGDGPLFDYQRDQIISVSPVSSVQAHTGIVTTTLPLLKMDIPGALDFNLTLTHQSLLGSNPNEPSLLAKGWSCNFDSILKYQYAGGYQYQGTVKAGGQKLDAFHTSWRSTYAEAFYFKRSNSTAFTSTDLNQTLERTYAHIWPGDENSGRRALTSITDMQHNSQILCQWENETRNGVLVPILKSVINPQTQRKFVFNYEAGFSTVKSISFYRGTIHIRSWKFITDPTTKELLEVQNLGSDLPLTQNQPYLSRIQFSYSNNSIASYTNEAGKTWTYEYHTLYPNAWKFKKCTSPVISNMLNPASSWIEFTYTVDEPFVTVDINRNGKIKTQIYEELNMWFVSGSQITTCLMEELGIADQNGNRLRTEYEYHSLYAKPIKATRYNANGTVYNTEKMAYDASRRVIESEDSFGVKKFYGYVPSGSDLEQRIEYTVEKAATGSTSYGDWRIVKFVYNAKFELIEKITDPSRFLASGQEDPVVKRALERLGSPQMSVSALKKRYGDAVHHNLIERTSYYPNGSIHQTSMASSDVPGILLKTYSDRFATGYSDTLAVTEAPINTTITKFDELDRPIEVKETPAVPTWDNTFFITTSISYDDIARTKTTIFANNTSTTEEYDALGNVLALTDEAGVRTETSYDELGRAWRTRNFSSFISGLSNAAFVETRNVYDIHGNILTSYDENNRTIHYTYNDRNLRATRSLPNGQVDTFQYDHFDRLTLQTIGAQEYAQQRTTSYVYDKEDRIVQDGDGLTYYNPDGSVSMIEKDSLNYESYTYSVLGKKRVTKQCVDGKLVQVSSYVYDNLGRVARKQLPGVLLSFRYSGPQLRRVSYGSVTNFKYIQQTADNKLYKVNAMAGSQTRTYDIRKRLVGISYPSVNLQYQYNNSGELTSSTRYDDPAANGISSNGVASQYVHDDLGQLVSESMVGFGNRAGFSRSEQFAYDLSGNRVSNTVNGVFKQYVNDSANRLTNANGTVINYDSTGTPLSMVSGTQQRTFVYDSSRRLLTCNLPNGNQQKNRYDGTGRRIIRSDSTGTSRLAYDDDGLAFEVDSNGVVTIYPQEDVLQKFQNTATSLNPTSLVTTAGGTSIPLPEEPGLVYESVDLSQTTFDDPNEIVDDTTLEEPEPIGQLDEPEPSILGTPGGPNFSLAPASAIHMMLTNLQGSTVKLVHYHTASNGATTVVRNSEYTAYGETLWDEAGTINSTPTFGLNLRYKGRSEYQTDDATGYDLLGERFYNPRWGRFLTQDPIGERGGGNFYAYCDNAPLLKHDPNGTQGQGVGQPGTLESMIPIWGSGRAAFDDFQNGNYLMGTLNIAFAISDVFVVTKFATAAMKFGVNAARGAGRTGLVAEAKSIGKGSVTAEARALGRSGESQIAAKFNIGAKQAYRIEGRERIADGMTRTTYSEVKNVKYQALTSQIRDGIAFAGKTGRSYNLYVRAGNGTVLSKPLQKLVDQGVVRLHKVIK